MRRALRAPRGDDGTVIVFVAIMIAVLLGFAGLAVDVGAMYHERRQLQNGADAAALAIAEACARGEVGCTPGTSRILAQNYANANAADGHAQVAEVTIDHDAQTVTVVTRTLNQDGSTTLRPFFASVLGFDGSTVGARAVAAWGRLSGGKFVAPYTFPDCVYWDGLGRGEIIYLFENIGETKCEDLAPPGGFGFLDVLPACGTRAEIDAYAPGDPGTNWPCSNADKRAMQDAIILIPIHDPDRTIGRGRGADYWIIGWAAFEVTGYRFPGAGGGDPAWPSGFECPEVVYPQSGDTCIEGEFVDRILFDGEIGDNPLGVMVVKLVE